MELLKYINEYLNHRVSINNTGYHINTIRGTRYLNLGNSDYQLGSNNIMPTITDLSINNIDTRLNSIGANPLTNEAIEQIRAMIREELRLAGLEE